MKIKDIVAPLEAFAPLAWQESYDNSGLVVGSYDDEAEAAVLCVDATEDVLDEAEKLGARLVISHHPVIFNPLKRLNGRSNVEKVVARAIRSGIALYACHTNLDGAPGGMSYRLAEQLGVGGLSLLHHIGGPDSPEGFGVIGTLDEPTGTLDFLRRVKEELGIGAIRHSRPASEKVRKIALCTGSAAQLIPVAKDAGAELFMAADFKYKDFMAADGQFTVADIGHFESEFCAVDLMFDIISKKIATFALHKSKSARNPVNYLV